MENCKIHWDIIINTGSLKGRVVTLITDLEMFEEETLSEMLIERNYLDGYCNDGEYDVVGRRIELITNL